MYATSLIVAFFVEGKLQDIIRRKKMETRINQMKNHYIICGIGSIGWYVVEEMAKTHRHFVVIEKDPKYIEILQKHDMVYLVGDATDDEVLLSAGIKKAKGVIASLGNDQDNLFLVLTARGLNPGLRIVTRANKEDANDKFRRAGADAVISPNYIGGMRMASEMLRPAVVSFLDVMLRDKDMTLRVEEIEVPVASSKAGKSLGQANLALHSGLIILAIKDSSGSYHFNPASGTVIKPGDFLIVMGNIEQVNKLAEILV